MFNIYVDSVGNDKEAYGIFNACRLPLRLRMFIQRTLYVTNNNAARILYISVCVLLWINCNSSPKTQSRILQCEYRSYTLESLGKLNAYVVAVKSLHKIKFFFRYSDKNIKSNTRSFLCDGFGGNNGTGD